LSYAGVEKKGNGTLLDLQDRGLAEGSVKHAHTPAQAPLIGMGIVTKALNDVRASHAADVHRVVRDVRDGVLDC